MTGRASDNTNVGSTCEHGQIPCSRQVCPDSESRRRYTSLALIHTYSCIWSDSKYSIGGWIERNLSLHAMLLRKTLASKYTRALTHSGASRVKYKQPLVSQAEVTFTRLHHIVHTEKNYCHPGTESRPWCLGTIVRHYCKDLALRAGKPRSGINAHRLP